MKQGVEITVEIVRGGIQKCGEGSGGERPRFGLGEGEMGTRGRVVVVVGRCHGSC